MATVPEAVSKVHDSKYRELNFHESRKACDRRAIRQMPVAFDSDLECDANPGI
jgi:hypothetical protein